MVDKKGTVGSKTIKERKLNGKQNGKKGEGEALPLTRLPTDVFMCRIRVSVKDQESERESKTVKDRV